MSVPKAPSGLITRDVAARHLPSWEKLAAPYEKEGTILVANVQVHKSQEYKYKYILSSSTPDSPLQGEGRRKRAKYGDLSPPPAIKYLVGLFRYTSNSVASITYSLLFISPAPLDAGPMAWRPGIRGILLSMTTRQLYFD